MTDKNDPTIAAINDARALLDTLLASDWREVHVVSGGTEIFMARPGGRANPMRLAPAAPAVAAPATPQAEGKAITVKAPHVATLVSSATAGQVVAVGERVAMLRVLDEEMPVLAATAGRVVSNDAAPGSLLDFDMPILTLHEVA